MCKEAMKKWRILIPVGAGNEPCQHVILFICQKANIYCECHVFLKANIYCECHVFTLGK